MSLDLIANWHRHEINQPFWRGHRRPGRLLAGFPLYGEKYATWFVQYGLPSLLAPANQHALKATGSMFAIYVDNVAREILEPLLSCGILDLRPLPETLVTLARQTPQLKYPLMTAVHSLLIYEAGQCNAGFGMAVGDLVYSDRYMAQLLQLGDRHDVIVHLGLSVDYARAREDLGDWAPLDGSLQMSAPDLGRLAYTHMQSSWRSWSMHDIGAYNSLPSSHLIHWRARDHIRVHCPHMGPVWLGPERCRAAGVIPVINGGIDAEQHLFGGGFYMPQLADDMMLITLNDEMPAQGRLDLSAFRQHLYGTLGPNFAHLPCFKTACYMPAAPSDEPWLPDEEIEARWRDFCAVLGV